MRRFYLGESLDSVGNIGSPGKVAAGNDGREPDTQLADGSAPWPCALPAAQTVNLKVAPSGPGGGGGLGGGVTGGGVPARALRVAEADFEPSQIQDLGDLIPALLEVKARCKVAMKLRVRLELGDGKTKPGDQVVREVNSALKDLDDGFRVV